MSNYKNFGDVDYLEYNGIWLSKDESSYPCYYIVTLDKLPIESDEEYRYIVANGYIDVSDSWFNWDSVYSSCDIDESYNNIDKAIALNSYYGIHEFGGEPSKLKTTLEALEFLEECGIELDKSAEDYKKEVLSEVFDILNDAVMTMGTNKGFIEDEEELKEAEKLFKELEEDEVKQEELCERFNYELDDIKEYISNTYGMHY